METRLINADGTLPTDEQAYYAGQNAWVGVDPTTRSLKVLASVTIPAGGATSAKQDTGNTSVASIDTKTPSLGQAVMASSTPVVIASNQTAVPISAASLPLPTGASTEATLAAISTKLSATTAATFSVFRAPTSAPLTNVAQAIKASAGAVFGIRAHSPSGNVLPTYIKFFNVAAGSVVVGTTVPVMVLPVPSYDSTGSNTGAIIITPDKFNELHNFGTAISAIATSALSDTGTQTAPTTGLLIDAIQYI